MRTFSVLLLFASAALAFPPQPLRIFDTPDAVVYRPSGYTTGTVVYWLHGYNMTAYNCPAADYYCSKGYTVVAPKFRTEADWEHYPIATLVSRYPAPRRIIDGFSKGARGAAIHAAQRPGVFDEVRLVAGAFHELYPKIRTGKVTVYAGLFDPVWRGQSIRYCENTELPLVILPVGHDAKVFYDAIQNRETN